MRNAAVTLRELKNKHTGLDLGVPAIDVRKGMLASTVEFKVVAVTKLSCFKSAKHKDSDVVQFMVMKTFEEIETLRKYLMMKFPGVMLPSLPKSLLAFVEGTSQEQKNAVDTFLGFLAKTPKLSVHPVMLEFLGVSPLVAANYSVQENNRSSSDRPGQEVNLFEDDTARSTKDEPPRDLFGDAADEEDEEDLFSSRDLDLNASGVASAVPLFAPQNLALDEDTGPWSEDRGVWAKDTVQDREAHTPLDSQQDPLQELEDDLSDALTLQTPLGEVKAARPASHKPASLPPDSANQPFSPRSSRPDVKQRPAQKPQGASRTSGTVTSERPLPVVGSAEPVAKPPLACFKPLSKPPVATIESAVKPPVVTIEPAVQTPMAAIKPAAKPPVAAIKPTVKPPVAAMKPTTKPPVAAIKPAVKPPVKPRPLNKPNTAPKPSLNNSDGRHDINAKTAASQRDAATRMDTVSADQLPMATAVVMETGTVDSLGGGTITLDTSVGNKHEAIAGEESKDDARGQSLFAEEDDSGDIFASFSTTRRDAQDADDLFDFPSRPAGGAVSDMAFGDILGYIQENTNLEEKDLFS